MKALLISLLFGTMTYAQTTIETPQDLYVSDKDNDGFAVFDLTFNTYSLLEGLDEEDYKITYHLTFKDADLNSNTIQKPAKFMNTTKYNQELYARVSSIAEPANYSVDLFTIRTHSSVASDIEAMKQ
ncbi:hypothetical protein ACX0HA_01375 [Flavobacterium hauense]